MTDRTSKIFELKRERERVERIIKGREREVKDHQSEIDFFKKYIKKLGAKVEKINQEITLWENGEA